MTVPYVVPFAGTWIETGFGSGSAGGAGVVPFAGTWIETIVPQPCLRLSSVVPFAGTWIETSDQLKQAIEKIGRSLRGNVD